MANDTRLVDGSFDFSGGCDSSRVTTVQSPSNPHGLARNKSAWLVNATTRNGAIEQRMGWQFLCKIHDSSKLYQGGWMYVQQVGNPYLVVTIGGVIYAVRVDTDNSVHQLSTNSGNTNQVTIAQAYLTQGEQFLVIQSGDWQPNIAGTPPLFWDGATLRRSNGLAPSSGTAELPAALAMTYYQGRIWYANGRKYVGGDIVGGPNGTAPYKQADSVLKVTENPLAIGGDGFVVPSEAGNITALSYTAQLDSSLGQGTLYAFTTRQINGLLVPVTRTDWIAAGNSNQPRQVVAQTRYGTLSERSVVRVNGDLFYASPEPAIRSLVVATRYFQQWGNVPISRNVQRAFDFTQPTLMGVSTGINFDNRLLQGVVPVQTPVGIAYQGVVALNFDLISTLEEQLPPAWEGLLDGFDVLQMFEGDFGGEQRAFAVVHDRTTGDINLFEITDDNPRDNADSRVKWRIETPAYTFGKEFELKELDGAEIWVDRIKGDVTMEFDYRNDASACWQKWFQTKFCAARTTCEDINNPICYPESGECEGYKFPIRLPKPPIQECDTQSKRPTRIGYQFQMRLNITGFCRIRGIMLYALPKLNPPYENLTCGPQ